MPFCAQGHNSGVHFAGWVREYPAPSRSRPSGVTAARAVRTLCSGRLRHFTLHLRPGIPTLTHPAAKLPPESASRWIIHATSIRGKIESPTMTAAMPERRPATEQISGVIERVTFHNDNSGFCVLRIQTKGQREETTVVGSLPSVTAGEWLVAEGCWVRDREHGLQFKATIMKTVPPTTAEGVEEI